MKNAIAILEANGSEECLEAAAALTRYMNGAWARSLTEKFTGIDPGQAPVGDQAMGYSGQRMVQKVKGYKWPGAVVAEFYTLTGQKRIVVECTVPEVAGALHIYNPEQVEDMARPVDEE